MTLDSRKLADILTSQQFITSEIALGKPLAACLAAICRSIETILAPANAHSSILLLENQRLKHGAAPTLPDTYSSALDGVKIGPDVGSCGTAMATGKQVIVSDIATDPLWRSFKDLALQHNLHACWSTPIKSNTGEILGSFAIYHEYPAFPTKEELEIIEHFSFISTLAIQHAYIHDELRQINARLSALTRVLPDLAIVVNENGEFSDIFGADESLLSANTRDLAGQKISDLLPQPLATDVIHTIECSLKTGQYQSLEYELEVGLGLRTFEGRVAPIEHYAPSTPELRHALWIARDITEKKQAELQIEKLAFYDPLTSLPNRRLLIDRLKLQMENANRLTKHGAILYLDLDDFKRINDSHGHSIGDILLNNVASRLEPLLRKVGTFARIGGDEFVVVLEDLKSNPAEAAKTANEVATRIILALEPEFRLQSYSYRIGVSIGISLIDGSSANTDEILKRADAAMYRSKKTTGSSISFFDPSLQEKLDDRLKMERALIIAIENDQLSAHFQPQVDLHGNLVAAEALVRWLSPDEGYIPPMSFIRVAERCGLMGKIQNLVLHESCKLLKEMQSQNILSDDFQVSINISPSQFKLPHFIESIQSITNQYGVSPKRIMLEITESMLVINVTSAIEKMHALRALGFSIAIDDFGIGYSSLSYLQNFPINQLKIDKSFIDKIVHESSDMAIIDAIIALATNMKFDIIVEGIEQEIQASVLSTRAINAMQGYFFSRPVPAADFMVWCKR